MFHWIQWQKYLFTVKGLERATQLPVVWETRMLPQHQQDRIFKFMLQWFVEFTEFNEISTPFNKNSTDHLSEMIA